MIHKPSVEELESLKKEIDKLIFDMEFIPDDQALMVQLSMSMYQQILSLTKLDTRHRYTPEYIHAFMEVIMGLLHCIVSNDKIQSVGYLDMATKQYGVEVNIESVFDFGQDCFDTITKMLPDLYTIRDNWDRVQTTMIDKGSSERPFSAAINKCDSGLEAIQRGLKNPKLFEQGYVIPIINNNRNTLLKVLMYIITTNWMVSDVLVAYGCTLRDIS